MKAVFVFKTHNYVNAVTESLAVESQNQEQQAILPEHWYHNFLEVAGAAPWILPVEVLSFEVVEAHMLALAGVGLEVVAGADLEAPGCPLVVCFRVMVCLAAAGGVAAS